MLVKYFKIIVVFFILIVEIFISYNSFAQKISSDTLELNISKAEDIFIKKNLALLANQYNVDINKALAQQAKVWDNPVLNTDQNIWDGKFFRHNTTDGVQYGQIYIQAQQLIRTAKKIKKQTILAQDNVLSAEAQFADVMRNLKYILNTDFNNLAQLQAVAIVNKNEMQIMQTLVKGMDEMLKVGDISLKENIRIKALLYSLQSDAADNIRQQMDIQKDIAMLLQLNDNTWVKAVAAKSFSMDEVSKLEILALQDSALKNRPDLTFAKSQSIFQQHNITYQQALAKPDITFGLEYDQNSSYTRNLVGLGISLPLPLFNKNKGNISAANFAYKQSTTVVQQVQSQVNKDVQAAYQKLLNASTMLNKDNTTLQNNYETMFKNMVVSYRQREVNLIEFIDFFDAFKDIKTKQAAQIANERNAAAELNFTTNQNIIKL